MRALARTANISTLANMTILPLSPQAAAPQQCWLCAPGITFCFCHQGAGLLFILQQLSNWLSLHCASCRLARCSKAGWYLNA